MADYMVAFVGIVSKENCRNFNGGLFVSVVTHLSILGGKSGGNSPLTALK